MQIPTFAFSRRKCLRIYAYISDYVYSLGPVLFKIIVCLIKAAET